MPDANVCEPSIACYVCGNIGEFICQQDFTFREALCPSCGSTRRQSDLAKIIVKTYFPEKNEPLRNCVRGLSHLAIFEAQASGPIHNVLRNLPDYSCSEYFENVPVGEKNSFGIVCQDLQNLTYSSDSIDLVITQDVFEHIRNPELAFREIHRVLKPGGFHIFTVPYHEGQTTLRRIIMNGSTEQVKYPPVYHSDPLRDQGSLVYTDFGEDMEMLIDRIGFCTEKIPCGIWYPPERLPSIKSAGEYDLYAEAIKNRNLLEYFIYNSWVFRSKKVSPGIGELPNQVFRERRIHNFFCHLARIIKGEDK